MQTQASTLPMAAAPQFYPWYGYRCAYDRLMPPQSLPEGTPLLLIHPIGVGLSRQFWQRFCQEWYRSGQRNLIYNPDLLGCGDGAMPRLAYHPIDWAKQLQYFLQTVVQAPVVVVVQGASLPIVVELVRLQPDLIQNLVLSGPPAWQLMTMATPDWRHRVNWNLFDSPLGKGFYRYARRSQFLQSFSKRQLFARGTDIDAEWLTMLHQGSRDLDSRHAVFAFLAGFWRQDYRAVIQSINQPVLVVMGEQATSISREGQEEKPDERLQNYLDCLPSAQGVKIVGRNVLPYETTQAFVGAIAPFVNP